MQLPSILIVEDDARLRGIIARNLGVLGYTVFEAGTFREATEQLAIKPALLILDITLPDATGWELARWIETLIEPPPILVISGRTPDTKAMQHFHPVAFLLKPFTIGELLTIVKAQLPVADPVAG
jgi:DNA-binding response OmpR family regulator